MSKYHVYYCGACDVKFAVDQELEDQSDINCPLCLVDLYLDDFGQAVDIGG